MPTLFHSQVTATPRGPAPSRWLLVLHGLLGRGSNWRTFTRALVEAHPSWGGALVDLRMHGESTGHAPPHTVEAAARDLDAVADSLPGQVEGVLGHSLGGKVALAWAKRRPGLRHAFLLDTNPGPRPGGRGSETSSEVLALLRGLPPSWPTREAFVEAVQAAGQLPSMARWLAMNLARRESGFVFSLELDAMEALLRDVLARDDWAVLESPPAGLRFTCVLGGRSRAVEGVDLQRLQRLADEGKLTLKILSTAGHWVQVDDPEGTLQAVSEALP
jgi:esterase